MEDEVEKHKHLLKLNLNLFKEYYDNYESRINKETLNNEDFYEVINLNLTTSENLPERYMEKKKLLLEKIAELEEKKKIYKKNPLSDAGNEPK